jgi:hypothetical protein
MQQVSFVLASEEERCFSGANNSLIYHEDKVKAAWRRTRQACCATGAQAGGPPVEPTFLSNDELRSQSRLANLLRVAFMDARVFAKAGTANRHVTDGTSRAAFLAYPCVKGLNGGSWPVVGAGFCGRASWACGAHALTVTNGLAAERQGMGRQRMKSSPGFRKGQSASPAVRDSIARLRDDEIIAVDPANRPSDLHLGDAELADRRQNYSWRKTKFGCGALWPYAHFVGPTVTAAAAHSGVLEETYVHADI